MAKSKTSGDGRNALGIVRKFFPSVIEVHDADGDLLLEVTNDDSLSGSIKDHSHCALARACQRKFKARGVIISVNTAYIVQKEGATRYLLPESVSREIVSFDRKGGFAEGEYMLKAPTKYERLGMRKERAGGDKHHPPKGGKPRQFQHRTTGIRAMNKTGEKLKGRAAGA